MPETKTLSLFSNQKSLTFITLFLLIASIVSGLFFNGQYTLWYTTSLFLLTTALATTLLQLYRHGVARTQIWLSVLMLMFWLYLGITIFYNPVRYLGIMNFWWLGVFPLGFLIYRLQNQTKIFWDSLLVLTTTLGVLLCGYALFQVVQYSFPPLATFLTKNSLAAFLNLLIFPLFSLVLMPIVTHRAASRLQLLAYPAVACFIFMLDVINSRGAWLAFILGMIVFLFGWLSSGQLKKSNRLFWLTLLCLSIIPIGLGEVFKLFHDTGTVDMASRLATLYDPDLAGHGRFLIWQPAWELLLQQPVKGIGLGTYFLAIQPYVHPEVAAHYYVHNDYLQLAIEAGVVAACLLFAIMLYSGWRFYHAWQRQRFDKNFLAITGVFCSILTLGVHSFFTFNLYLIPTMILAGLMLARFDHLTSFLLGERDTNIVAYIDLQQVIPARYFYPLLVLITASLWYNFATQALSSKQLQQARTLAASGNVEQAHYAYQRAQNFTPVFDIPFYSNADLLRRSADALNEKTPRTKTMYLQAEALLEKALKLNPLRPQTPFILGKVYERLYPDKPGEIVKLYDKSLRLNPQFVSARLAKAEYLITRNQPELAYQILHAGIGYTYMGLTADFMNYLSLYQKMTELRGDETLAKTLKQRLKQYEVQYLKQKSISPRTQ